MKRPVLLLALLLVAVGGVISGCGTETVDTSGDSAAVQHGGTLFAARCGGCHTLKQAGTQGSATKVSDRERTDGPNFNVRKVCYENALYALRNGGYSGAIMPANIVVGQNAKDVAAFVAKYSGSEAQQVASPTGPAVKCPAAPENP